ncbi:hypothetical protein TNCV_2795631 [Trichonephila clavipes]|nr:hypothetical protein TNCV_2795631 [Trichonephila clavipes]
MKFEETGDLGVLPGRGRNRFGSESVEEDAIAVVERVFCSIYSSVTGQSVSRDLHIPWSTTGTINASLLCVVILEHGTINASLLLCGHFGDWNHQCFFTFVWLFWRLKPSMFLYFCVVILETGTINASLFCVFFWRLEPSMLRSTVAPSRNRKRRFGKSGLGISNLALDDIARPHSATATQNYIATLGWERLYNGPDLAPSDFHLIPALKKNLP